MKELPLDAQDDSSPLPYTSQVPLSVPSVISVVKK